MKELKAPWMHWHSQSAIVRDDVLAPGDPLRDEPIYRDRVGAEKLERFVRAGIVRWNRARFDKRISANRLTRASEFHPRWPSFPAEARRRNLDLDSSRIRELLFRSVRQDPPGIAAGQWHERYGHGRSSAAALRFLDEIAPTPASAGALAKRTPNRERSAAQSPE